MRSLLNRGLILRENKNNKRQNKSCLILTHSPQNHYKPTQLKIAELSEDRHYNYRMNQSNILFDNKFIKSSIITKSRRSVTPIKPFDALTKRENSTELIGSSQSQKRNRGLFLHILGAISVVNNINGIQSRQQSDDTLKIHYNFQHIHQVKTNWEKNYEMKVQINSIIQENKSFQAKIQNIEKEQRSMMKQLEGWGMINQVDVKPFINSITLQKVFKDIHYQSQTLKQQLLLKHKILKQKDEDIRGLNSSIIQQLQESQLQQDLVMVGYNELYNHHINNDNNKKSTNVIDLRQKKKKLQDLINAQIEKNKVLRFHSEVQEKNLKKVTIQASESSYKYQLINNYYVNLAQDIKQNAPFIQYKTTQTRNARRAQMTFKSADEISAEKLSIIEDYVKRIDNIHYQDQELSRLCIMERQDISKVVLIFKYIQEMTFAQEDFNLLAEEILKTRSLIVKFKHFGQKIPTDFENHENTVKEQDTISTLLI